MEFEKLILLNIEDMRNYFIKSNYSKSDLISFMIDNKIPYKANMNFDNMLNYLCNELQSYGMFYRISHK